MKETIILMRMLLNFLLVLLIVLTILVLVQAQDQSGLVIKMYIDALLSHGFCS
jgi:preprotein translocase subunit SecG